MTAAVARTGARRARRWRACSRSRSSPSCGPRRAHRRRRSSSSSPASPRASRIPRSPSRPTPLFRAPSASVRGNPLSIVALRAHPRRPRRRPRLQGRALQHRRTRPVPDGRARRRRRAWVRAPPIVAIPIAYLAGALLGAAWGFIPGALKAWTGAHEVVTTIMLNFIASASSPTSSRGRSRRLASPSRAPATSRQCRAADVLRHRHPSRRVHRVRARCRSCGGSCGEHARLRDPHGRRQP